MAEKKLVAENVSKRYKDVQALAPLSLALEPGKIYGLIGRNGAGKTTLLSVLTAQVPATSGTVQYGGERVWENEKALSELCFSRELHGTFSYGANPFKVKHYLRMARCYYPHWDEAYAQRLVAEFALEEKRKMCTLSKGMMSMLTIVLALASRAPVTLLDEPVAGLDVPMRERFYRLLLDDYEKTGRTFVVSTHIIEEAAPVFEEIILLHEGRLLEQANTEEFLGTFHYLQGHADRVVKAAEGFEVLHSEELGRQKTLCVRGDGKMLAERAREWQLELAPVPLQKAFVYATGGANGEVLA